MRTLVTLSVPQPAVTTDWSFVPSHQSRVKLESIYAQLSTSATAGTRAVSLQTQDLNNNILAIDVVPGAQAASTVGQYNWRPGNTQYGNNVALTQFVASCAGFWLPPQSVIRTSSVLVAGDQWTSIFVAFHVDDELLATELEAAALAALEAG